jgi:choline kinase
MNTQVIILAQGTQQRLGRQFGPKQLFALPACGGVPIMCRTVRQVWHMTAGWWPTIVTWSDVKAAISWLTHEGNPGYTVTPAYYTLSEPGNSSLKGIARYLEQRGIQRFDHTVVLLGDVVYSWACLESIWKMTSAWGFVGTSNLSNSTGELWGVAWSREHEDGMIRQLGDALLRHPPFEDEYQPGQLRRWITGWQRGALEDHVAKLAHHGSYLAIDDYTHDIDLPRDMVMLPDLSASAAADDALRGVSWTGASWDPTIMATLPEEGKETA